MSCFCGQSFFPRASLTKRPFDELTGDAVLLFLHFSGVATNSESSSESKHHQSWYFTRTYSVVGSRKVYAFVCYHSPVTNNSTTRKGATDKGTHAAGQWVRSQEHMAGHSEQPGSRSRSEQLLTEMSWWEYHTIKTPLELFTVLLGKVLTSKHWRAAGGM